MHIYVLSRAHKERMHLPSVLIQGGVPFKLVVDTEEQASEAYRILSPIMHEHKAKQLGTVRTLVSHADNIVGARNFITRYHLKNHGRQYYCGMDDNIRGFTMVMAKYRNISSLPTDQPTWAPKGKTWRQVFNKPCTPQQFVKELEGLCDKMVTESVRYGGVATMENPFFRGKRYSYRRFVKSKVFIMDPTAGLEWQHTMCHDSHMTALCVARYGRVLVDNYLFYRARWYERGGLGSRAARDAAGLTTQLQQCVQQFPGLVGLARGRNSALRILKVTDASVDRWRREHGYI